MDLAGASPLCPMSHGTGPDVARHLPRVPGSPGPACWIGAVLCSGWAAFDVDSGVTNLADYKGVVPPPKKKQTTDP